VSRGAGRDTSFAGVLVTFWNGVVGVWAVVSRVGVVLGLVVGLSGGVLAGVSGAAAAAPVVAVRGENGDLWVDGQDRGVAIAEGSSPAAALSPVFGPLVALRGDDGRLRVWSLAGVDDRGVDVMAGTSPAITVLPTGGVSVAFQSTAGVLQVDGSDTGVLMAPGTSPSLAFSPLFGPFVGIQGRDGDLWVWNLLGPQDKDLPMAPGSSPSLAALPNGAVSVAFGSDAGELWVDGENTGVAMEKGTSPALTHSRLFGPHAGVRGRDGNLVMWNGAGVRDWGRPVKPGTSPAVTELPGGGVQFAVVAPDGHAWSVGTAEERDTGVVAASGNASIGIVLPLPVIDPTVPAPPPPAPADPVVAFHGSDGHLWVNGTDTGAAMADGSSPAVAVSGAFGPFVAFPGADNDLWVWSLLGSEDRNLPMMPGTSPAIAVLPTGGVSIAVQSNGGRLLVDGADTGVDMAAGTSPALAFSPSFGPFAAVQGQDHDLWVWNLLGVEDKNLGMWPGTSPSMTVTANGGVSVAFGSNAGELWVDGANRGVPMAGGTSPALAFSHNYGPFAAVQGPNGSLWVWNLLGASDWAKPMKPGSSPAITELPTTAIDIAYDGDTGTVWTTGYGNTGRRPMPGTHPAIGAPPYRPPTPPGGRATRMSEAGIAFLHHFEGRVLHPYNDSAGHCTIGWGHLIHRGGCTDQDRRDYAGFDEAAADRLFRTDIVRYEDYAVQYTDPVALTQSQFDAIVSFVYNLGPGNFSTSSVRKDILNDRFDRVPADMLLWDPTVCGLRNRHTSEGDLFAYGDYEPRTVC
jgi:GH24 family phage-related lysozyme (muramidase)